MPRVKPQQKVNMNSSKIFTPFNIAVGAILTILVVLCAIFIPMAMQQESAIKNAPQSKNTPENSFFNGYNFSRDGVVTNVATPIEDALKDAPKSYDKETYQNNITLYVDYACPHCKEFEDANFSNIERWLLQGDLDTITINPVNVLQTPLSLYGASTIGCVATHQPENLLEAHKAITALADPENGMKVTNLQDVHNSLLTDGVITENAELKKCSITGFYANFVESATMSAVSDPLPNINKEMTLAGTPTIFVNGEHYPGNPDPAAFEAFFKLVVEEGLTGEEATAQLFQPAQTEEISEPQTMG